MAQLLRHIVEVEMSDVGVKDDLNGTTSDEAVKKRTSSRLSHTS